MDLETLIILAIKLSIILTVFGFALHATPDHALYLFRHPVELFKSIMSMNVLMPLFTVYIAEAFSLHPAVRIALLTLAVSPVPPFLPKKELKAGAHAAYAIGLLTAAALFSIILVPLTVELFGKAFGRDVHIAPGTVAKIVFISVILPVTVGIAIRYFMPGLAERLAKPISTGAAILLIVSVIPILFKAWPSIVSLVGNGTILAILAFLLIGVITGHLLGGPDADDRTVLALSTASRHPGVAMAVATANFPEQKLVLAAVLLYFLVNLVITALYLTWRRHHQPGFAGAIKT